MRDAPPDATPLDLSVPVAAWAQVWDLPGLESRLRVSFSTRMWRSLGRCQPERRVIRLAAWLRAAPAALLAEVLCHEVAHVAVHELHGRSCRPHGAEWKALMRAAGFQARARIPAAVLPPTGRPQAARRSRRTRVRRRMRARRGGRRRRWPLG